jgi:hypothetical protein
MQLISKIAVVRNASKEINQFMDSPAPGLNPAIPAAVESSNRVGTLS